MRKKERNEPAFRQPADLSEITSADLLSAGIKDGVTRIEVSDEMKTWSMLSTSHHTSLNQSESVGLPARLLQICRWSCKRHVIIIIIIDAVSLSVLVMMCTELQLHR